MTKNDFEGLLIELAEKRISEYYLTPGAKPQYRMDKALYEDQETSTVTAQMTEDIMSTLLLEREEQQLMMEGNYELPYSMDKVGRFRLRFGRQRSSITLVILIKSTAIPALETLRVPAQLAAAMDAEQGLLVVSGETKSGKYATIASLLKHCAEQRRCVITTAEDPVEYLLPHGLGIVNQMEVGIDVADINTGLREGVNNHSDIVYISDMSGAEDFNQVFSALEKGFFVVASMNAGSVGAAIDQIIFSYSAQEQIHVKRLLANHLIAFVNEERIQKTDGQMMPVYEVLMNNAAVKSMFLENKMSQLDEIFEAFPGTGMNSRENALFEAVLQGLVEKDMAIAFARDSQSFIKRLNGVKQQ